VLLSSTLCTLIATKIEKYNNIAFQYGCRVVPGKNRKTPTFDKNFYLQIIPVSGTSRETSSGNGRR
jgi:hypothetical protein